MPDDRIQLVCFDLGDVLVRICRGWEHAAEVAGVPGPASPITDDARVAIHGCICRSEVGDLGQEAFATEVAAALGVEPHHVLAMSDAYLRGPYPGVERLIDDLHAVGVATACLSNTNANHWRLMTDPQDPNYLPLDRMAYRFASHLVRQRKPDETIYRHVEQAAGLPPSAILFFDNLVENVDAARARGWHAEVIDTSLDDPIGQARHHLTRYDVLHDGERTGIR